MTRGESPWTGNLLCAAEPMHSDGGTTDESDVLGTLRVVRTQLDKLLLAQEKVDKLVQGQERLEVSVTRVYSELRRQDEKVRTRDSDKEPENEASHQASTFGVGVASMPMQDSAAPLTDSRAGMDSSPESSKTLKLRRQLVRRQSVARLSMTAPSDLSDSEWLGTKNKSCINIPLHPDSRTRAMWDVASVLVLLYESIIVPIQISWQLKFHDWILVSGSITLAFWFMDLLLGFATGFRKKNMVIMGFGAIAKRYCMTYFLPNLVVVTADLVGVLVDVYGDDGVTSWSTTIAKIARLIKMNRLLRLASMFRTGKVAMAFDQLVAVMRKYSLANQFSFSVSVVKLVFLILWVNHFGTCIWYVVFTESTIQQWEQDNNVADAGGAMKELSRYLLGYYWSTSSMVAGESIMYPRTMAEMACTMFFILFGFMFSSIMISSLLTTVMDYGTSNKERSAKLKMLRQFLYQHNVSSKISMPIEKQVSDRIWKVKRLSEKDVTALSLITPVMRAELSVNIYGPSIRMQRFIRMCESLEQTFIKNVSFWALRHIAYEPGKHIFEPNAEADGVKYVSWGFLEYLPMHRATMSNNTPNTRRYPSATRVLSSIDSEFPSEGAGGYNDVPESTPQAAARRGQKVVKKHEWFCEVALWAHWRHRGWMDATTPCEVLTVLSDRFLNVLTGHPELLDLARQYGEEISRAAEMNEPDMVDDLALPIEHEAIVCAMPLASRQKMSEGALNFLYDKEEWTGRLRENHGYEELQKEINKGDCDLLIYPPEKPRKEETVLRVVTIVALRIQNSEGVVLAQIGKFVRGQLIARCTYPGTKQNTGELPQQAVERMLETKLKPLKEGVLIDYRRTEQDNERRKSAKYGVNSVYARTLFQADFQDSYGCNQRVLPKRASIGSSPREWENRTAFTLEDPSTTDATFIFAWLSTEEYEEFTQGGKDKEKEIERWLKHLETDHLEELSRDRVTTAQTI